MYKFPSLSPRSLQDQCLQACSAFCLKYISLKTVDLKYIHQYLEIASPLIIKIASKCRYHASSKRTLIFIPFLTQKGQLIISDANISDVIKWFTSIDPSNEGYLSLCKITMNAHKPENYFDFLSFIPKLPNVTKLVLNSWANDDVFAAIGLYCKNIEILDARDDDGIIASDTGLGFLSHCKALKMVLFSKLSDEYDYEDKFKFSGTGVALLMISLPKLCRIECPEYLIRDALHFIYQMSFQTHNHVIPLTTMFLDYPDVPVRTLNILPIICPHLEKLSLYIPRGKAHILKSTLQRFLNLKSLKLKFEDCWEMERSLINYNMPLENLILDVQYIHEENIYLLDATFKKLKCLVFIIHSFGFIPDSFNQSKLMNANFQNLHTLQIDQRVSGNLFKLMNIKIKSLKAVYCYNAVIYDAGNVIESIISNGGWSKLILLALPEKCSFTCDFLFNNVAKLKNLKILYASLTNLIESTNFISKLHAANLQIQLCTIDELPLPSEEFMEI